MTTEGSPVPEAPSFGRRVYQAFLTFLRALVRLVLILLVAVVIGLIAYTVLPRIYQQYVQPVQDNAFAIEDLRARHEQDSTLLSNQLDALQERLDALEVQNDQDKQQIAELQDELAAMEALIAGNTEAWGAANEQMALLGEDLDAVGASLGQLDNEVNLLAREFSENVDDLSQDAESNREAISNLALEFNAAGNPINVLRRELELVKVMELVTRSRIEIAQQNLGLAETDIQRARDLLLALEPLVFEFQQPALLTIVERLELALENFPEDLDLVEADLEVTWELLLDGLPMEPPVAGEGEALIGALTPTPTVEEAMTPTPEATPEPTPTTTP